MATQIARAMVAEYGMSEKVGPMSLGHEEPNPFFGGSKVSGATAQLIDEEVTRLLNEAHDEAERVLNEHRDLLNKLSGAAAGRRDDRRRGPRGLRGRHQADPRPRDRPPGHAGRPCRRRRTRPRPRSVCPTPTPQTPPMPAIE